MYRSIIGLWLIIVGCGSGAGVSRPAQNAYDLPACQSFEHGAQLCIDKRPISTERDYLREQLANELIDLESVYESNGAEYTSELCSEYTDRLPETNYCLGL